jgi:uncharacterized protein
MKWRRVRNPDVIDRRGARSGGAGFPMGRGGAVGGGLGLVGVIVVLALQLLGGNGAAFDVDPGLGGGGSAPGGAEPIPRSEDPERDLKDFSTYVFTDVQKTWEQTFRRAGQPYEHAQLVLYRDGVRTACGAASSSVGPFYCPGDQIVYLDLSFYADMQNQLRAGGDFAWAYVIAHEVGHHVQQQLGTSEKVRQLQRDQSDQANELSVRLELQADCYSGVWAHTVYKQGALDKGDVREALRAAGAVGDDRLQKQATGSINPDSFTHGTSEQRRTWFERGYEGGDPNDCDTFSPENI